MTDDPRHPPIARPTEERTADPVPTEDRVPQDDSEDVVARTGRRQDTPRRYDEDAEDDVMPADDSSLNTKI
jgi:hypothetical protein